MPEAFPAVYEVGNSSIWVANINREGKQLRLGFFTSKVDAQTAYDAAVAKYARDFEREDD